jgi:phosphoenolpyruvate carboxylase
MANFSDPELQQRIRDLGATLGETIASELGDHWLEKIEEIRLLGRSSVFGEQEATSQLIREFSSLQDEELLVIARAFSQFLNLANLAEQEFNSSNAIDDVLEQLFEKLKQNNDISAAQVERALNQLNIDLVLTAHPTEVIRRTFIHKYSELTECLSKLDHGKLTEWQRNELSERIAVLINQAWHTDEIRSARPSPVDEAKWGLAVIEKSLWKAVPSFVKMLHQRVKQYFDIELPVDFVPVQFNSWMGGDRDGNPFVTSKVTQEVLWYARHRAAELFAQDIADLCAELSMSKCSDDIREQVGDVKEPYRALLTPLRKRLEESLVSLQTSIEAGDFNVTPVMVSQQELLSPLMQCYQSLIENGMSIVANDKLVDTIRRANCFGVHLLKLDVRQDSERHADVIAELTRYLGIGDYHQWSEEEKQAFLIKELNSKRPLFPSHWQCSDDVKEVLDTCRTIAQNEADAFGIYIISMASLPSDVLAVKLLLNEMGVDWAMPVAPLFETLDDLNHSEQVMTALYDIDWYRGQIKGKQFVMIGYSDSAKDAGALAAGWAQYQAQEKLLKLSSSHHIELTLFHGRGGTIGRGGLPAYDAIRSQPPGSLHGGFRVTEQGETIRYKFGTAVLANQSLMIYASAILEAILLPPPVPQEEWRAAMTSMAELARDNYRGLVRDDPQFVPYFRTATPEQELGKLPLGSRPAKRKPQGGVESLRAIPWIFAWAQTRLVLPSWLGVMPAVQSYLQANSDGIVKDMIAQWPFFRSRLSMLDMVFAKANGEISAAFDERLVPDDLKVIGVRLRDELKNSVELLLSLLGQEQVMESDPRGLESMQIRSAYLQPLHYLQIELLSRIREQGDDAEMSSDLEQAMMVTIGGIAIGMRNTG